MRGLFAAALVLAPGVPASAQAQELTLASGEAPVCSAYLEALSVAGFDQIPRCQRPEVGDATGFQAVPRTPLPPEEVGRLFAPVVKLLAGDRFRPARGAQEHTDAPLYVRAQQRVIEAGHPTRFFYRFEPQPDIDNDGAPDDVVIWKDKNVPCGFVRHDQPDFSPTHALLLDRDGNLDVSSTRAVFGLDETKWLGDSFGVFRFEGQYYFDTFNSYANRGTLADAEEEAFLQTLSVYHRKNGQTRRVCEIRFSRSG